LSNVDVTSIQQLIELDGYTDSEKWELFFMNFWIIFVWFDYASWGGSDDNGNGQGTNNNQRRN
jgi:hypothetical protein